MFKEVYSLYFAFCTRPVFYSQSAVCSLHFTLSVKFTPGPQSAVCSLCFTLTAAVFSSGMTLKILAF